MRILIDIGHPAHVHLFKNFAYDMINKDHVILFTYREKEYESELLKSYGFDNIRLGKHYSGFIGKIWGLLTFNLRILKIAWKFKPDFYLSHGSMYASHIAWLTRKPHISLEDSGNLEQIRFYKPFTSAILCPEVLPQKLGPKEVRYNSYHELYYLHPDYFTPNKSIYKYLNIKETTKFVLVRFVSFKATHDIGYGGLNLNQKRLLISYLKNRMKVFISSESELPDDLKKYHLNIPPERIHDVLFYATLVISEGATMASESGVLGTPALYINNISRAYNTDQEQYGLVYNLGVNDDTIDVITETISHLPDSKSLHEARNQLLRDKINPTLFLIWFFETWPESMEKKNQQLYFQDSKNFI